MSLFSALSLMRIHLVGISNTTLASPDENIKMKFYQTTSEVQNTKFEIALNILEQVHLVTREKIRGLTVREDRHHPPQSVCLQPRDCLVHSRGGFEQRHSYRGSGSRSGALEMITNWRALRRGRGTTHNRSLLTTSSLKVFYQSFEEWNFSICLLTQMFQMAGSLAARLNGTLLPIRSTPDVQ